MKVAYFKIQILLNLLSSSNDEKETLKMYHTLREECRLHFVRFEVFYKMELQEKVHESQRQIQEHVIRREYELAALKRDSRLLYEFKLSEIDKYFYGQSAPAIIVDSSGLVRCLLDKVKHELLIQMITTLSRSAPSSR